MLKYREIFAVVFTKNYSKTKKYKFSRFGGIYIFQLDSDVLEPHSHQAKIK